MYCIQRILQSDFEEKQMYECAKKKISSGEIGIRLESPTASINEFPGKIFVQIVLSIPIEE